MMWRSADSKSEKEITTPVKEGSKPKQEGTKPKSTGEGDKGDKQSFTGWQYKEESYDAILSWVEGTQIEYKPEAKRPGTKSRDRYDKYSKARTVGEALALGSFPQDLLNDFEVGYLWSTGGPFREQPLDKYSFEHLAATGRLTETDKKLRQFISKGGRYPQTAYRPKAEKKANGDGDSAKRAKPSAKVDQVDDADPEKCAKAQKLGSGSLMGFFKGDKVEAEKGDKGLKAQSGNLTGFLKSEKAESDKGEKTSKGQSGNLLSLFTGDKTMGRGERPCEKSPKAKQQSYSLDDTPNAKRPADPELNTPLPSEKRRHVDLDETTPKEKGNGLSFLARLAKNSKAAEADKSTKEPEKAAKVAKAAAEELERCAGAGALARGDDDDVEDEVVEEEENHAWDLHRRQEIAMSLWGELGGSRPGRPLVQGERIPFTAVLEAFEQRENSIGKIAALLCPLFAVGSEEELAGIVDLLLVDHGEMTNAHTGHSIALAFGMNSGEVRALPSKELPGVAAAARKKQRTFCQGKKLAAAEVGKALAAYRDGEGAKYSPWNGIPNRIPEQIAKVLVLSTTEREAWHLIRIFQGKRHFSRDTVLRGLAHAAVLAKLPSGTCPRERTELIIRQEDAVLRAFAQSGGRIKALASSLLQGALAEDLVGACPPTCGTQVLHMQAEMPKDIAMAVDRIGEGPMFCEWLYVGERAQVHVTEGGNTVEVFSNRIKWTTDKHAANEEAKSILGGCLNARTCILDVILVRGKTKAEVAQQAETAVDPKDDKSKEAERAMVILDILQLDDRSLCQTDLRERRAELQRIVKPTARVRFPFGCELSPGAGSAEEIALKLEESLSASNKARTGTDAVAKLEESMGLMRTQGLVLKKLDGKEAHYSAGRDHNSWQMVRQQSTYGPEADRLLLEQLSDDAKKHVPEKEEFMFCVVSGRRTGTKEGIRDILLIQKHYTDAGVSPRWYVDVASLESYRKLGLDAYPGGKLIPSRNMALDDAFRMGKVCVQTSDDISKWEYFVSEEKGIRDIVEANARARFAEHFVVSPVAAAQFLLASMRARRDCKLGGVYCLANSGRALCNDRFGDHQFIMGDFFVAEPSDIRFDTRLDLKEDYDYTASHLAAYGNVMRCNHLLIHAKHLTNAGGACSYRNSEREQRNIAILKEKWGTAVRDNPLRENEVILCWGSRPKRLGGKR